MRVTLKSKILKLLKGKVYPKVLNDVNPECCGSICECSNPFPIEKKDIRDVLYN